MAQQFLQWSPRTEDVVHADTSSRAASRYWRAKTVPPQVVIHGDFSRGSVHVPESLVAAALHKFHGELKYRAELMKEYLFESIRQEEFPALPSRKRCMFLLDAALDPQAYRDRLKLAHQSLYQVTIVEGRWHRARTSLLDCNVQAHETMVERARAYWSLIEPETDSEVLFEGRATLHRVSGVE